MNKSTLFKKAHALTQSIIKNGFDYKATFGACIRFVLENAKIETVNAQMQPKSTVTVTLAEWKAEADMPEFVDGEWVDMETGISYNQVKNTVRKTKRFDSERAGLNDKAKNARQVAKKQGCKALKGSPKQKAWGEDIRRKFVQNITDENAMLAITSSEMTAHAKFWIENRNWTVAGLENVLATLVTATAKANEIGYGNEGYNEQVAIRNQALAKLA